ncbi:thioredoxin reductase [Dyadobacter sp. BE34]|uniref:Thioredoxin reductase n=1 Tax=Dyadobacter fermentans TaxID=94254 RepID=A0ABU1R849_9BACT|nr:MULTISPECIES: NAD(P)/FAD-dependent oxidoreductase [Dyadobacter]MDR6809586.1 thioredoxin reductase [Dyadobacter fermentans]MDR7047264.1 thioredoxin reductase [Dyadobacter sp. BE242]MDR7201500.1 thioredoxin reductase [Dyadobacter sp. BE34]MDR7219370.1 thioredoxin reductase [Dyadobacter sp. BE31]MDR7267236.1 thioredoxin reductase [Dyadobacter sp. BE32]
MKTQYFDVIVVGGSYAGLAAAMALGRASKHVLIIDNGKRCNQQTPCSHNFLTQDGQKPREISQLAREQVSSYPTISFNTELATRAARRKNGFEVITQSGTLFLGKALIFATGIKDLIHDIYGFSACWGISVLHCPYCHGYEVKNQVTGIIGSGRQGYDFARLISNWTKDLTLFSNGSSGLTDQQAQQLSRHQIQIIEKPILKLDHIDGKVEAIVFAEGPAAPLKVAYALMPFTQHSLIPESMGCGITSEGYVQVDAYQQTTIDGVYACGDNSGRMRTIANAVATGTTAGMIGGKRLIMEEFGAKSAFP